MTYATGYAGSGVAATFNNTWGHFAPVKNVTYRAVVRFTFTSHSEYGSQAIVLDYTDLTGPYFHDAILEAVSKNIRAYEDYAEKIRTPFFDGIWDIPIAIRNHVVYFSFTKAIKVANSLS